MGGEHQVLEFEYGVVEKEKDSKDALEQVELATKLIENLPGSYG